MVELLQSADASLDTIWLLVAAATLLSWRACGSSRRRTCAIVALAFILVLLFPIVSTADDVAEQARVYDLVPSHLTVKNSKEVNSVTPGVLPAIAGSVPALPVLEFTGDRLDARSSAARAVPLSSATGNHSPPLF